MNYCCDPDFNDTELGETAIENWPQAKRFEKRKNRMSAKTLRIEEAHGFIEEKVAGVPALGVRPAGVVPDVVMGGQKHGDAFAFAEFYVGTVESYVIGDHSHGTPSVHQANCRA